MADPAGAVSIAFNANPMVANPVWTRIDTLAGCRVREWTVDRGRPDEFAKTDTGTAVVRLVDRQGLFDPTNSASPYNGKILPGKQAAIALQNPVSDAWFTIFRGFIESWYYRLDKTRQFMELELQLVDGFALLAAAELQVGIDNQIVYEETTGSVKDRIDAVLDEALWPAELRDVFSGNVRLSGPKAYSAGTSALDVIWDAVDGEFPGVGNCFIGAGVNAGKLVFRGRQARFRPDVAEYGIQRRTVGDPSHWVLDEDTVPLSELEWSNGQDNLFNAVTATPQQVEDGDGGWRQLNPGDPDNDDITGQHVRDATSITTFGVRSLTFDHLQTGTGIATGNTSLEETRLFALYYRDNYKTPATRIARMVFKSRRPGSMNGSALWLHLCKCEISDLLTLQTDHPSAGGFNEEFYVEGIHYTCRPGNPAYPIVELALDVSPRAHYTSNPFDADDDP